MQEKETLLLKGEINTRIHINDVQLLLMDAANELLKRAKEHDASKLEPIEHEAFSLAAASFGDDDNQFGTPEYESKRKSLGVAIQHHYESNTHHPEHYRDGVIGMNLFDLLEMLIDWKAASERRSKDGVLDLSINKENHKIPDDLMRVIENTADYLNFDRK